MSSVRMAILKPSPAPPSRRSAGRRQPSKRSVASGCGAITSIRSAIEKPGSSAKDDESGEAARARRFAGAGEHSVDVRDAAVRDPGLLAIQAISVVRPRAPSRSSPRHRSRPPFRKARRRRATRRARTFGSTRLRCSSEPAMRDRAGAQALHGEGEIGEAVMISQRLAREADAARVDRGGVAVRRRDRSVEQARFAKRAHQIAAGSSTS